MGAPSDKHIVIDPSQKASAVLDYVINETEEQEVAREAVQAPVKAEINRERVVASASDRERSRVLFITQDLSVLEKDSLTQLHFLGVSSMFEEIHIMLVCEYWQARRDVVRLSKNVWVYTTSARYWWLQTITAQSIAKTQLQFVDGFRPDVIVALDPFESGMCALALAHTYKRALQVHVIEDFLAPDFKTKEKENKRRLKMAAHVLARVKSVRTATMSLKEQIKKKYTHLLDVAILPRHYDVASIVAATQTEEKKDLFPQYAFVILFVGKLDHESTLFRALDACRSALQSDRIALVVVGEGPAKKEFQTRAEILGISKQVIFKTDSANLISYISSADVLFCTDTTEESEELVIKAAAAGLPLLMSETPLRADLFVDGESGFLCNKEDTIGFFQKLSKFINMAAMRTQLATNAKDIIKTRLHEDPNAFKQAYKDSIEAVFETMA